MAALPRRVLLGVGLGLGAAVVFALGVLVGVVGSHTDRHSGQAAAADLKPASAGIIDEAADRIEQSAMRPVDRQVLERAAVEGMLKALGDKWSAFYAPNQYNSFEDALDGHFVGVGLWLTSSSATKTGPSEVTVGSVQAGSPAQRAGIAIGDRVLAVDGREVHGQSVDEVAGWMRAGAPDSSVALTLRNAGGTRTVRLQRVAFPSSDVSVSHLKGDVLVIHVATFSRGTGREVRQALAGSAASAQHGVILDLRGNPGGLLTEAVESASAFLDGGPVVSYERRDGGLHTLDAVGTGNTAVPLVVLVDHQTASAAEVVSAALQDRGRAVVVGTRTFGKGSVQEPTSLSDGSALELTVARYLTPAGRSLEGVGVTPDVQVDATSRPEVAEQRALDVLSGLVATLNPTGRG